ncbi:hypothetical protein FRC15_010040 [Serendipita sp. 397]|nr:hypothetical protein FRC15_010040 [Serendipita sp. 397]
MTTTYQHEGWRNHLDSLLDMHMRAYLAINSAEFILGETKKALLHHLSVAPENPILHPHPPMDKLGQSDHDLQAVSIEEKWNALPSSVEYLRTVLVGARSIAALGGPGNNLWCPENDIFTPRLFETTILRVRDLEKTSSCNWHPSNRVNSEVEPVTTKNSSLEMSLTAVPIEDLASPCKEAASGIDSRFAIPYDTMTAVVAKLNNLRSSNHLGPIGDGTKGAQLFGDVDAHFRAPRVEIPVSNVSSPRIPRSRTPMHWWSNWSAQDGETNWHYLVESLGPPLATRHGNSDDDEETHELIGGWGDSPRDEKDKSTAHAALSSYSSPILTPESGSWSRFILKSTRLSRHCSPPCPKIDLRLLMEMPRLVSRRPQISHMVKETSNFTFLNARTIPSVPHSIGEDQVYTTPSFEEEAVIAQANIPLATSDALDDDPGGWLSFTSSMVPFIQESDYITGLKVLDMPQIARSLEPHTIHELVGSFAHLDSGNNSPHNSCLKPVLPYAKGVISLSLAVPWQPFNYCGSIFSHESVCDINSLPSNTVTSLSRIELRARGAEPREDSIIWRRWLHEVSHKYPPPAYAENGPVWSSDSHVLSVRGNHGRENYTVLPTNALLPQFLGFSGYPDSNMLLDVRPEALEFTGSLPMDLVPHQTGTAASILDGANQPVLDKIEVDYLREITASDAGSPVGTSIQSFLPSLQPIQHITPHLSHISGTKYPQLLNFSDSLDSRSMLHRFLLHRGIDPAPHDVGPICDKEVDSRELLSPRSSLFHRNNQDCALDLEKSVTSRGWSNLVLPDLWTTPQAVHYYLAPLSILQRHALVRCLESHCNIHLVKLGGTTMNSVIIDSHTTICILKPSDIAPLKINSTSSTIAELGYGFSRILVIFEEFSAENLVSRHSNGGLKLIELHEAALDSLKELRRKVSIGLGCFGTDGVSTQIEHTETGGLGSVIIEYTISRSIEDTAEYIRLFGDSAEVAAAPDERKVLWSDRTWLREVTPGDHVCLLGRYRGMNPFASLVIASVISLGEFVSMKLSEKQRRFGGLVGWGRMRLFDTQYHSGLSLDSPG